MLEYPQLCFEQKYEKYLLFFFLSENFQCLEVKLSIYLNRRVFVMIMNCCINVPVYELIQIVQELMASAQSDLNLHRLTYCMNNNH